jgi:hypothetical protein
MSFFSKTDTGVIVNRFSQDLQLVDMELPVAALNTFASKHAMQLKDKCRVLTPPLKPSSSASRKWFS